MNYKLFCSVLLLIAIYAKNTTQECLCNVRRNGEYCGTELNERNGNSDCDRNMYFCGNSNSNKTAVLLVSCPERSECDVKVKGRNACLRRISCRCRRGLSRGPHCGNQLEGKDCGPNVLFTCRLIGSPSPRDACPNGCEAGKCVTSVAKAATSEPDSEVITQAVTEPRLEAVAESKALTEMVSQSGVMTELERESVTSSEAEAEDDP